MRSLNNLYEQIISLDNLRLADENARRGKRHSTGVKIHDLNRDNNIFALHKMLVDETFTTSAYSVFTISIPKHRTIYRLPYYPDRILHHALLNILEPIWVSVFITDSYSCIKGRGIIGTARAVRKALSDVEGTTYCLKFDIRKFYETINHNILKQIIAKKIKDKKVIRIIHNIIDSADGVPIGNYTSQFFANLYLSYFDHWIKEEKKVKYYFRYADDFVLLSHSKEELHHLFNEIKAYIEDKLKLEIKKNYQVFPVQARGIDFVGYRFWHTHILLRKSIKKRFARSVARKGNNLQTQAAYWGWAKHCNSRNLLKKLNMKSFSELNVPAPLGNFTGEKIKIAKIINCPLVVLDAKIEKSKYPKNKSGNVLMLQIEWENEKRVLFTGSDVLIGQIEHVTKEDYPFKATIVKEGEHFEFK